MDTEKGNCRELISLDHARRLFRDATSFEEILEVRDYAETIRQYAENVARCVEMQNQATEVRLRAERAAGLYLRRLHLRGGKRCSNSHAESLNLEKLGIDRNESSRWQKIAQIPEEVFEGYFQSAYAARKRSRGQL